jgi:hypothetical protein
MHSASNDTWNRLAMALRTCRSMRWFEIHSRSKIARHQQVAGEVVRLTLDDTDVVGAGVHAFLVAVETRPLIAVQDEVAQFMSDGEALAFGACLAVDRRCPTLRCPVGCAPACLRSY